MRRFAQLALLVILSGLFLAAAPTFRLPGVEGGALTAESLADRDTIVVVWASWSPRCRKLPEQLQGLRARWGSRARIVTVNFQEDPAAVRAYLSRSPLGVPTFLDRDGQFSKGQAVTSLPGLVVFRDGKRVLKGTLGTDADRLLQGALGS